jgi:DNA-binding CsgD family transcriptional regulator
VTDEGPMSFHAGHSVLPSTPVAPAPNPAGLTPREIEVLRLLARGLRRAQIAKELVIGVVTVNSQCRLDLQQARSDR